MIEKVLIIKKYVIHEILKKVMMELVLKYSNDLKQNNYLKNKKKTNYCLSFLLNKAKMLSEKTAPSVSAKMSFCASHISH